jgi:hypothetical protein
VSIAAALPTDAQRIVEHWRAGVLSVPPHYPPCQGMTAAGWPDVHAGMIEFLDTWGVEAVHLGFGTRALFGVHRLAAAFRVDATGALVNVNHMPVVMIEPSIIRFANGLVNRGMTNPAESIPLWDFVRSARARAG